MDRRARGADGERRAVELLERKGYTILARNYRRRAGEIDLIAFDGGEVVFVEVKARSGERKGSALSAVTPRKQRTIARVAEQFLAERGLAGRPCRFDVVALVEEHGGQRDEIVRGAFVLDR